MTAFRSTSPLHSYAADLTMFRFNGTHEFHIQCTIVQCFGRCPPPLCFSSKNPHFADGLDGEQAAQLQLVQAGIVSKRLYVSDVPPRTG